MSFAAIPLEVLADHRLSHRQLRVLLALYSFKAKDSAEVWPKRQTLAARCGLPLTRISQVTTELQALGWLSKIGAGGCSCPTHYTLTIPQTLADSTETAPVGNTKTVTESVTVTDSVTVTKTVTPTVTETVTGKEQTIEHKEVGDAHARESDGAGFASFWAAYPRKKDKAAALKAWHRLKPSADLQAIIQSDLSQRPRQDDQWKRGFIPHPGTYLNGHRWEDDFTPIPEQSHAPRRESSAERFERLNSMSLAELRAASQPARSERVVSGEIVSSSSGGIRDAVVVPIADARGYGGSQNRVVGQGA